MLVCACVRTQQTIIITFILVILFFFFCYFQLGIAIGFVLPSMLVANHDDINLIGEDLKFMFYLIAGITTILLLLVVLCK